VTRAEEILKIRERILKGEPEPEPEVTETSGVVITGPTRNYRIHTNSQREVQWVPSVEVMRSAMAVLRGDSDE